ncbi:hypothetical protein FD754_013937, partial [Muntiacus muntjak]
VSDNHENKEQKQRLNFSYCEEEHENKGQKEIQERKEAPKANLIPPELPLSNACSFNIFQGIDKVSPDQGLMTPVPHSLTCPETPAPPDEGNPPLCENLFTPKGQLTPGPFTGEMTSLALVKQFLKSNGKRKTQGDLEEAETNMASHYEKDFLEVEKNGAGEFGTVCKWIKRLDGCIYAIKCSMKTLGGLSDENLSMQEVHAHVVPYYSAWAQDEHMIIWNEYCKGGSLQAAISENAEFGNHFQEIGDLGHVISVSKSKVEKGYNHFLDNEILQKNYQHLPKAEIFRQLLPTNGPVRYHIYEGNLLDISQELCKEFHKLLKNMIHSDPSERTSTAKVKFSVSPWGKTEEFQQQLSLERFKRVTLERRLKEAQLAWSLKKCHGVPGVTRTPTGSRSTTCLLGGKSAKSSFTGAAFLMRTPFTPTLLFPGK